MRKSIGVVLVLFQVSAHAGNLHVAQGGVGLACTDVDPCGSVQLAVDQAVEGDVVAIAPGVYRENILVQTAGITLLGESANNTIIQTKGGREGAVGNAGNPLDAIVEVQAANISLINLTLMHPRGNAVKREAAVFAWKGAPGLHIKNCIIERQRNRRTDEPTTPGSRGVFILAGPGGIIEDSQFRGNYQDHVHLPSKEVTVRNNVMIGASRAGISVMDPVSFVGPNVFDSTKNVIIDNVIMNSLDDGIHIQGDQTTISNNTLIKNKGFGIYLCGEGLGGGCYFPGEEAVSEDNILVDNVFSKNKQGTVGDFGAGNAVQ